MDFSPCAESQCDKVCMRGQDVVHLRSSIIRWIQRAGGHKEQTDTIEASHTCSFMALYRCTTSRMKCTLAAQLLRSLNAFLNKLNSSSFGIFGWTILQLCLNSFGLMFAVAKAVVIDILKLLPSLSHLFSMRAGTYKEIFDSWSGFWIWSDGMYTYIVTADYSLIMCKGMVD